MTARHENLSVNQLTTPADATIGFGTAAPTVGTYKKGSIVLNTAPAAAGYMGWTCVTAGTPGTWKGFGAIEA